MPDRACPGLDPGIRHPDDSALDPGSEAGATVHSATVRKCPQKVKSKMEKQTYITLLINKQRTIN